jgi:Na+-translocating ferredoxin:NAD+ oxidoreductase subunit B
MTLDILIFVLPILLCLISWMMIEFKSSTEAGKRRCELEIKLDALLPQTQCSKCGFNGCQPYARAISTGKADINLCPPGGPETIKNISILLGRENSTLDSIYESPTQHHVALIDEQICIGCVKCINACPVDAIIGAAKQMHTVIDKACTGCELCIAPCPVDCISMVPVNVEIKKFVWTKPQSTYRTSA